MHLFIGVMADTKGPEIRTGDFKDDKQFFSKGDHVKVVNQPILGTKEAFFISSKEMFEDVKTGDFLLIDDGKIRLDILENQGDYFRVSCDKLWIY